jgi:hypothetical protein
MAFQNTTKANDKVLPDSWRTPRAIVSYIKWLSTDTQSASFIVSTLPYEEKIIITELTEHCDIIYGSLKSVSHPQVG